MEDKEKAKTKLYKPFTRWYTEPGDTAQYEEKLKNVAVFDTIEDFWAIYQHIARPNVIPQNSDYNLFVDGIKPMWEDEGNRNGGKWLLRMQKGFAEKFWEELVLCMIGHNLDNDGDIVGLAVSNKATYDIISIWNKDAKSPQIEKTKEKIRSILGLSSKINIEYKAHPQYIHK